MDTKCELLQVESDDAYQIELIAIALFYMNRCGRPGFIYPRRSKAKRISHRQPISLFFTAYTRVLVPCAHGN